MGPLPSAPHPAPPADSQPWEELKKELEKLKQENEALKILQDRRDGPRARYDRFIAKVSFLSSSLRML